MNAATLSISTSRRQWAAVLSVAAGTFAMVTTEFLPVGMLTEVAGSLKVSTGTAGLMVTTPGAVAALAAPAAILAAGRVDRRVVVQLLTALIALSNLISALAPNLTVMLIGRVLLGLGVGGFWTFAATVGRQLVPQASQGRATAMIMAGVSLGTVAGLPLGALIADVLGWRPAFYFTAMLATVAALAQAWLLPVLKPETAIRANALLQPLRSPAVSRAYVAIAVAMMGQFAAYTYIKPLLQSGRLGGDAIGQLLLGYGLAGAVGAFIGERVAASSVRRAFAIAVALIAASTAISPWLQANLAATTAMLLVWGLAMGAMPVAMTLWLFEASPRSPEAAQALLVSVTQIALALGAAAGGFAFDHTGVSGAMGVGAGLALIGLLLTAYRYPPTN